MLQPTKALSWVKAKFSPGIKTEEADPEELQKILWTEVEASLRQYLKALIESMLKTELEAYLDAKPYERSEGRKDYRNGSYGRSLGTKHGTIEEVRVPRTRSGDFEPKVFERYERRNKNVNELIGTLFLNGISTRKLEKIAQELLGVEVTHSTVGHIAGEISAKDCLQFQEKELKDEYRFLRRCAEARWHERSYRRTAGGCGKRKRLDGIPY
jgi:transposase-like protein